MTGPNLTAIWPPARRHVDEHPAAPAAGTIQAFESMVRADERRRLAVLLAEHAGTIASGAQTPLCAIVQVVAMLQVGDS
jgi:hypothetical protein